MLRHQYVDLFKDLFEVRDAKWKKEEKNMNVSALLLFLPLYIHPYTFPKYRINNVTVTYLMSPFLQ